MTFSIPPYSDAVQTPHGVRTHCPLTLRERDPREKYNESADRKLKVTRGPLVPCIWYTSVMSLNTEKTNHVHGPVTANQEAVWRQTAR